MDTQRSVEPTSAEIKAAQVFVVKEVQRVSFLDELQATQEKKPLPKSSKLASLSPFADTKGFLRVGGRLRNAAVSYDTCHQSILLSDHHVTRIIVRFEHVITGHVGVEHTLANLRSTYWILNGHVVIKGVLRRCFFCQVRRAIRAYPYMADLPKSRLAYQQPPFTNCGVDVFGHVFVKQGRKRLKRWGVIYTCLTVRCIHLEVIDSCDTDAFLNSFRRFTNQRGCPESVYSDRGSNFQGAVNELDEFYSNLDRNEIQRVTAGMSISWEFNPQPLPIWAAPGSDSYDQ